MSKSVEMCAEMGSKGAVRKYLFFGNTLVIGETVGEGHKAILESSGRQRNEVKVAGGYSVIFEDQIVVHGGGSGDLEIGAEDPTPVVEFVKQFSDAKDKLIQASL